MTSEDSRNPLPWREQARRIARVRRWSGALAALLLCLAALTLVDGLVALMRAGSTRIELIAGQSESLSGPVSSKHPVPEDLRLRLTPETAPVEFRLEGFFPSYWFGNGMWRGVVSTPPGATPGRYGLTVGFRGGGGSRPVSGRQSPTYPPARPVRRPGQRPGRTWFFGGGAANVRREYAG